MGGGGGTPLPHRGKGACAAISCKDRACGGGGGGRNVEVTKG